MFKSRHIRWAAAAAAVLALGLGTTACSTASGNESGGTGGVEGKTVIYVGPPSKYDFVARLDDALVSQADEAGFTIQKTPGNSPAEQAQLVNQAIGAKPDAIAIYALDTGAILPSLQRVQQAGIPLLVINGLPPDADDSYTFTFAGADNYAAGVTAAEAMIQGFEEKGHGDSGGVIIISGLPEVPGSFQRVNGFTDTLKDKAPGIKILADQPGYFDQTQAQDAAAGLFASLPGQVQGVYGVDDPSAAGAIAAARSASLDVGSMVFVGNNCDPLGAQNIESGEQYATILQDPVENAQLAVAALTKLLTGEKQEQRQFISNPLITKADLGKCAEAIK